ncbi:permease [Blastopirellula sp. J2-11]|uniref:permease n=1 Tax=Blastopirellula sp. J2-11 TaxID=2943192 RepID=UPI0021C9C485|nr:permease [Blastopirellula sp. J2-11]UUO06874.1 permease [Blastopirellula sp. J2-11]
MTNKHPRWAAAGDVNAFFGLMLDNIADLLLTIGLLATVFNFPTNFAISHMAPGTAIGVFVGDLAFFFMALALAKRTGRNDVTAMPLGLDTPSTFGMVFFVLGPAFNHAQHILQLNVEEAAVYTWHIGICSIVISGLFKVLCAFGSGWIRKFLPRAGLLGSLAAVALVLISFLPFVEAMHYPVVGMTALAIILTTLVARIGLPKQIPGALAALLIAGTIYYVMSGLGILGAAQEEMPFDPREGLLPTDWLAVFRFGWIAQFGDALHYLPVVIPFALGTVIGGIDCVESAAAVGDEYDTDRIILVEAIATLIAGLCGGVIQTTPYIGHPAYKAMGGRSAYVLATAIFVGGAGTLGYFGYLYWLVPKSTVFPILVFIGLEITAQSFLATSKKHYAAVSLACVPALAALVLVFVDDAQGQYMGQSAQLMAAIEQLPADTAGLDKVKASAETIQSISQGNFFGPLGVKLQTLRMLSGGFILTSLMWGSALAMIIDRRLLTAAGFFATSGLFALFGVIHSPLPGSPVVLPWAVEQFPATSAGQTPVYMLAAYLSAAVVLVLFHFCRSEESPELESKDDWKETT